MSEKKEQIIIEIKRVADLLRCNSLKQHEFKKHSDLSVATVHNTFGSWSNAVIEAGLQPTDAVAARIKAKKIDDDSLLKDLIRLESIHGKITAAIVNSKGVYSAKPYLTRWGSIKFAFEIAKANSYDSNDIDSEPDVPLEKDLESGNTINLLKFSGLYPQKNKNKKKPVVGIPIDFRGMRFSPINEQGVVYLFGVVSQELGFLVETVRVGFPDCEAKRFCGKNREKMEHVKIEFEYKSSNFLEHGHDAEQCDLIVCWEHDWKECPLEVLELKKAINFLPKIVG